MNFLPANTVLLDDQRYKVEITLINSSGELPLPNGVVQDLIIEDNLYSIFFSARLIINSSENMIESFVTGEQNELKEEHNSSYLFNFDNRDHIQIEIVPVTSEGEDESTYPPDVYKMEYLFSIYDEEEILSSSGTQKIKVLYLKDARAQILEETNMQWSTAYVKSRNSKHNINVNHTGNRLRQVKTGTAIANLLVDALPTFNNSFATNWDAGATDIFYTSSPQSNAFDDLEALLDKHISAVTEDNCILRYQRNGSWSLLSYSAMFETAVNKQDNTFGPNVTDIFNLHAGASNNAKPKDSSKIAPYNPFGMHSDEAQQLLGLTAFHFLNVSNQASMKDVISTFVHTYNSSNKQFNIDGKETHINAVRKKFQKLYADPMVGIHPTAVFPTNTEQVENKVCRHVKGSGAYRSERLKSGVNRVLNNALAQSPGVSFSIKGSTHREAGDFAVIVGSSIPLDSAYGKIMQGEWLITSVTHTFAFEKGTYLNTMIGTKPHASAPLVAQ